MIDVFNHPHMEKETHFIELEKRIGCTLRQTNDELCYYEGNWDFFVGGGFKYIVGKIFNIVLIVFKISQSKSLAEDS